MAVQQRLRIVFAAFVFLSRMPGASAQLQNAYTNRQTGVFAPTVGMAVTTDGRAYLVNSYEAGGQFKIQVIDYDSVQSRVVWSVLYTEPNGGDAFPVAIKLDPGGNVVVAGTQRAPGGTNDYVTLKFDGTSGQLLWGRHYNGSGHSLDMARALAVDTAGNVCVTGWSVGDTQGTAYATVKYGPDGTQRWVKRYYGAGYADPTAIATDGRGNVYVTGTVQTVDGGQDYGTVKYDMDGNQLWYRRYNGPTGTDDYAESIAVDSSGSVYVTGLFDVDQLALIGTLKYDTNGNLQWVRRFGSVTSGPGYAGPAHLALDGAGNVIIASSPNLNINNIDFIVSKYRPDGFEPWHLLHDSGVGPQSMFRGLTVDSAGNIAVTGLSTQPSAPWVYAITTVKYRPDGVRLWLRTYRARRGEQAFPRAIATDALGSVYVAGYIANDANTYITPLAIKYFP